MQVRSSTVDELFREELRNNMLTMSQQCALVAKKASGNLECIQRHHGQQAEGGDPPPLHALVRAHME